MEPEKAMRNAAAAFTVIVLLVVGCLLITIFSIIDDENQEDENDTTVIEVADDDPATVVVTQIVTPFPTAFSAQPVTGNTTTNLVQPTPFVIATAAVNTTTNTTTTTANCILRTDWAVYTVQDGDILANIAVAAGTTLDELIAANCIANPDAIYTGQQLYVPTLPVGDTGVTALGAGGGSVVTTTGTYPLTIDPALAFQNNTFTVDGGLGVRITWTQLPLNALTVDFFFTQLGTTTPALITTDGDLTDGAIVSWTVPDATSGTIHAVATLVDGTEVQSAIYNVITQ